MPLGHHNGKKKARKVLLNGAQSLVSKSGIPQMKPRSAEPFGGAGGHVVVWAMAAPGLPETPQ